MSNKRLSPSAEKILQSFYGSGSFKELPDWAKDAVHTHLTIQIGWRDRLRVLFGHDIKVVVSTWCENMPGRAESETQIQFFFPWRLRRKHPGFTEAKETKNTP